MVDADGSATEDVVRFGDTEVTAALAAVDREALLGALAHLLDDDRATVFVVEDAQWADDATLDVLRWLLRRLVDHRALLLLTYQARRGRVDLPPAAAGRAAPLRAAGGW